MRALWLFCDERYSKGKTVYPLRVAVIAFDRERFQTHYSAIRKRLQATANKHRPTVAEEILDEHAWCCFIGECRPTLRRLAPREKSVYADIGEVAGPDDVWVRAQAVAVTKCITFLQFARALPPEVDVFLDWKDLKEAHWGAMGGQLERLELHLRSRSSGRVEFGRIERVLEPKPGFEWGPEQVGTSLAHWSLKAAANRPEFETSPFVFEDITAEIEAPLQQVEQRSRE